MIKNLKLKGIDLEDICWCINKFMDLNNQELYNLLEVKKLKIETVLKMLNEYNIVVSMELKEGSTRDCKGIDLFYLYKTLNYLIELISVKSTKNGINLE